MKRLRGTFLHIFLRSAHLGPYIHMWRTQIKNLLSGPGSDREIIRILSKQLYLGTDDRLHFASFRASDSSFEGTVVTGLVDLVE